MTYLLKTRKRTLALFFVFVIQFQVLSPSLVYALTSGPTQPEVQSFQPAGTTEMVDLFTGDFTYNIPLFELPGPNGGYPFNLSYQAGVTMDQEASWVGLGWSLQPGAINRQMRGLPDEFKGDDVYTKMSIDPSVTVGLGAGAAVELFGGAAELGLGLSVYNNNYKGVGYSIDGTVGFEKAVKGMTGSIGLGFKLDSQEGIGVNPSLGLGGEIGTFGLNAGYNSKQGLSNIGMSFSGTATLGKDGTGSVSRDKSVDINYSSSISLTLAHPSYTPQITMPMKNISLSATLKLGGSWWGVYGSGYVTGFYNEQWLANNKKRVATDGYGYLNYQDAADTDLVDYNRDKDGLVSKESPNLPLPSLSYDIYSVTGQGIGMMYRPVRNDYGIIHDQETSSVSDAVGAGVDVGPAAAHVGLNLSLNHSKSTSGKWKDDNLLAESSEFQKKERNSIYEPWYFKVHGEPTAEKVNTLNAIGGEKAVRVKLAGQSAVANLENKQITSLSSPVNATTNRERKPRSQTITALTNGEILTSAGNEMLTYFKISYINSAGDEIPFTRTAPRHHFAGYTALTADGLRYVYALPAYNKYHEEVVYSARKQPGETRVAVGDNGLGDPSYEVTGTDKFLRKTELPPYAHSFLLTSILGPDYVDVTNDGITEDDLGYWVKFTYQKTTTDAAPYKWRDPFYKAHFQEGWRTDARDDKGTFVYGEKEMWYLARAETRSHIATFTIEARDDGRGVLSKLQDSNGMGAPVYVLRTIKLFTRSAGESFPIKITRFQHDYSLCPGIDNSINSGGKLTLRKLWFEYGSSQRGRLNHYDFKYNNDTPATSIGYDIDAYDRWGNYNPYPVGQNSFNRDFPYANQDPSQKNSIDAHAAAWSLREITLPSGAKVTVNYEADDYAYVQQKTAMQMVSLVNPNTTLPGSPPPNNFQLSHNSYKIRFKLEKSISGTLTTNEQKAEVLKYLDAQSKQLYFKILVSLRKPIEGLYEYITGYADIDFNSEMKLEKLNETGDYLYGSFYLKGEGTKNPFSMRAWQHLRTNQPDLANPGNPPKQVSTKSDRVKQITALGTIAGSIKQMFDGYYDFCDGMNWGEEVIADKSWIRLNSPDKVKYGGGLRVKQITMVDQWGGDDEGIYGQIYDYTTSEGSQVISSGVAAYEPIIGGDENALRYGKKYVESIPLRTDNNLFFEYPVNESYYPGPQVGYSKVAVMSLPAAALAGKILLNTTLPDTKGLFPTGSDVNFGTSGMTIHEFYTAKEFPVITDETEKANKQQRISIAIPFLGSLSVTKLASSQGYSIITNNMHGRLKKVSTFRQDKTGKFEPEPMSWVKYNFLSEQKVYNQQKVSVLQNALKDNGDGTLGIPTLAEMQNSSVVKYHVGQQTDFFHDMRQFEDKAWGGGARGNLDMVYIPLLFVIVPIPVPTAWPSITKSTSQLRTSVSNKIIFRAGILESVEAFDGGSLVKTNNLKWDKLTGNPILTSVNNNFDAAVYNYTRPAYLEYQGMGAAYQNVGITFSISAVQKDPYRDELYQFYTSLADGVLFPGDEILLYANDSEFETPVAKVIYTGDFEADDILYTEQPLTTNEYKAMIVRSGYRNQLTVAAGTITALQDPSVKGTEVTYTKTITVPK